jgi:hypothetical protein
MHGDSSPPQALPYFSQGPGPAPASTLMDGGESRLAPEGALDQAILDRGGADASPTRNRDAGPGSLRESPRFEHGAGI